MSQSGVHIAGRTIGPEHPPYVVAELSANHGRRFQQAVALVQAAADAGADAVKLQTYTPDTLTLDCDAPPFHLTETIWAGRTLYDLYREAAMPWAWQPELQRVAHDCGLELFSSPFDATAVAFLEEMSRAGLQDRVVRAGRSAPLARRGPTGKPVILSTGMATLDEIDEAVATLRQAGCRELVLLKCTSAYPAGAAEMNLRAIPALAQRYGVPLGLSDHCLDAAPPVAAVALGACFIEKHLTLARAGGGPDAAFSLEPAEFAAMVRAVRTAYAALGRPEPQLAPGEEASRRLRRSLFAVRDIRAGEHFTGDNVTSIRPADGLHPHYLDQILGRPARSDIARGTPLAWSHVG